MVMGDEGENPVLEVVKARSLYTSEAQWLGLRGIVMATGLRGEIWEGWEGAELITWPLPSLNGWDLLAMETVRLIHTTPLGKPLSFPGRYYPSLTGPSTKELVARVTNTIRLVTEMLKSDWSLSTELQHITSQALHLLQRYLSLPLSIICRWCVYRFSSLPRPPSSLLASSLSCMAAMATKNPTQVRLVGVVSCI